MTVRGGGGRGLNPYSQPDRKKTSFFMTSLNLAGKSRFAADRFHKQVFA